MKVLELPSSALVGGYNWNTEKREIGMNTGKDLVQPPADVPEIQRGNWYTLTSGEPVAAYLSANHWPLSGSPSGWEVARLSHAAFIYRETGSGWSVVVKFYTVKTGAAAEKYVAQEFRLTQQAYEAFASDAAIRSVRPLAAWSGALFLEYVDGLTLEDLIAVRRSRPGTLLPGLQNVAALLAGLHTHVEPGDAPADFAPQARYAREILANLVEHGVLQGDPLLEGGLQRLIGRWERDPAMSAYRPALSHGDATTSNFIFPWAGGLVAIDWERAHYADPAADLGRLMAEVAHSIKQHGGSTAEALPFVEHLADYYCQALPADWDAGALLERARFHQASSTLRIARNGWISPLDRTNLVAQAFALLA